MNFIIYYRILKYIFVVISLLSVHITGKDIRAAQQTELALDKRMGLSMPVEELNVQATANSKPINLNEAIEIALEQNLELAAKRKRLDHADAKLKKASLLFPSNPKIETEIGSRNSSEDRHTDYNVSLSQEVEVFGQRRKRLEVAQKNIEGITFHIKDAEREIIANVKSIFFQALTIQEVVKLQYQAADIFKRLRDATQERYKAGAIASLELNSIQIQYGLVKQQLNRAKNDFQKKLTELKLLLSLKKDKPLNIIGDLSYKPIQLNLDDLLTSAFKHRPDLKASEFEKERATSEIALRKVEIIPNPELSGFFNREEGSDDIVGGKISISIPIWDRKQSELKRARTAKDIAEINIENKYLQIENEINSAYHSFIAAVQSINIFDNEIIPQVDENLKLNEVSYSEGKINFINFLTVQNNLIETKAIYLNTLLNYKKAIINLETVTGIVFRKELQK